MNKNKKLKFLVTGSSGFIGFHLSKRLLEKKILVYGIDNLNTYYDIKLKKNRNRILKKYKNFKFKKIDICNFTALNNFVKKNKITYIVHLAAQAGVRNSIKNPKIYVDYNLLGFFNICEVTRLNSIKHLFFASTSSVYGETNFFPVKETANTDKPQSLYAATKKSNEVIAYSYNKIFKINITCLRFFTVYGTYGRPDMSIYIFVDKILKGRKINLHNQGNHVRDFTYIDDVILMISKLIDKRIFKGSDYECYNICNSNPVTLKSVLKEIEKNLLIKSKRKLLPMQLGDVYKTHGSNNKLLKLIGKFKNTSLKKGIKDFISWYLIYNKIK